jgi:nitrate reductase NapE component
MTKDILTTKRTRATKGSEIITFQFLNFVLFATFVVKCLFRFWLRLRPH